MVPDCRSKNKNGAAPCFGSKNDLKRHSMDVHHTYLETGEKINFTYCPFVTCKRHRRGFARPGNVGEHIARIHHGRLPDGTNISTTVRTETHQDAIATIADSINTAQPHLDTMLRGEDEPIELPASLSHSECLNDEILFLFYGVLHYWYQRRTKRTKVNELTLKIDALANWYYALEAEQSVFKHKEECIQREAAKQTSTVAKEVYQKDILESRQRVKDSAAGLAKAKRDYRLLEASRNEVLSDITKITETLKCFNEELRGKRFVHDGGAGDQTGHLAGPTSDEPDAEGD